MKLKAALKEKEDAIFSKNETFEQQNSLLIEQINQQKIKMEIQDGL